MTKSVSAALDHIMSIDNEFSLMGLPPTSTVGASQLNKRFQKISLLIHPDKCNDERATAAMQKLNEARDDLLDVEKLPGNSSLAHRRGRQDEPTRRSRGHVTRRSAMPQPQRTTQVFS